MRTFRLLLASFVVLLTTFLHVAAVPLEESRAVGISQAIYDNLVLYTKYCAASYGLICPRPVGSTLVQKVHRPSRSSQCKALLTTPRSTTCFQEQMVTSHATTAGRRSSLPSGARVNLLMLWLVSPFFFAQAVPALIF